MNTQPIPNATLIGRLERAPGGGRELNRLVGEAVGLHQSGPGWRRASRATTSLDAALALAGVVLGGWSIGVQANRYSDGSLPDWSAYITAPHGHVVQTEIEGQGKTAALALAAAVLRALGLVVPTIASTVGTAAQQT